MNRRIIIVSHEPLTKRNYSVLNIDGYIQRGLIVEYWDITKIVSGIGYLPDTIQTDIVKRIANINRFSEEIKKVEQNDDCTFILEFPLSWKNRRLILLLSQSTKSLFQINFYANTSLNMTLKEKLINALHEKLVLKIRNKIAYTAFGIFKKIHNISIQSISSKSDSNLKINHPDYESYRDIKGCPVVLGKYMVFIDTFFPYHPDFKYLHGNDLSYLSSSYFNSLNTFFEYLEFTYNMPMVIAAHPKAEYTNEFGDRQIIKYETLNLICFAETVFIHASNAISYIVLANKPFVFISNDAYSSINFLNNRLHKLAEQFHAKVENVDTNKNIDINRLNEEDRKRYIYTYLTDEKIEKYKNIDLLISYFKNENKCNNTSL